MSEDQKGFVDREINKLLKNGSIKKLKTPFPKGWTSNIFLVPKKTPGEYTDSQPEKVKRICDIQ